MAFGDYSYYWVADRQNRTFRRLNELYARTDQVGFLTTQRVDGKADPAPNAVQRLQRGDRQGVTNDLEGGSRLWH